MTRPLALIALALPILLPHPEPEPAELVVRRVPVAGVLLPPGWMRCYNLGGDVWCEGALPPSALKPHASNDPPFVARDTASLRALRETVAGLNHPVLWRL